VTQLINGLVTAGLAERHLDRADRRAVRIQLSPEGRRIAQKATNRWNSSLDGLNAYLGEAKSRQLAGLLREAISYFEAGGTAPSIQWKEDGGS